MGSFESHPWLLVPIVILTVEGWNALKAFMVGLRDRSARLREL